MKLVVVGYGAWAKAAENPAARVVSRLRDRDFSHHEVILKEVPVLTHELYASVDLLLTKHAPRIWLGVGLAAGSETIRLETIATNQRTFDVPDNAGVTIKDKPVFDEGPETYRATVPNQDIVNAINQAGIPAALYDSAGTHLCNQMLYTCRHLTEAHGLPTLCGFIHVPYATDHIISHCTPGCPEPSMTIEMMTKAARITINQCIESAA